MNRLTVYVKYAGPAVGFTYATATSPANDPYDELYVTGAPSVTGVTPATITIGDVPQTITVNGTGFYGGGSISNTSSVTIGGTEAVSFQILSDTQLTAIVPFALIGAAGVYDVVVSTTGGASSTSVDDEFTVNPLPVVTGVSPKSIPTFRSTAGAGTTITVNGSGFLSGHAATDAGLTITVFVDDATYGVVLDGILQTSATATDTQLSFSVPDEDLTTVGAYDVQVTVQYTGPAASSDSTLPVTSATSSADILAVAQRPAISAITPNSAPIGAPPQLITIQGFEFYGSGPDSDVQSVTIGGTDALSFQVLSDTRISAIVPTSTMEFAGVYDVAVTTTGGTSLLPHSPGVVVPHKGYPSRDDEFTVTPNPIVTGVSPSTIAASRSTSGSGTTITVNGSGFSAGHIAH